MQAYVVIDDTIGTPQGVSWTEDEARKAIAEMIFADQDDGVKHTYSCHPVSVDSLSTLVNGYFRHRNLTEPDAAQAFAFAVSELGELADAYVQLQADWVRNNPDAKANTTVTVGFEAGDTLMMLTKFAEKMDLPDPLYAMVEKMRTKGYQP